MGNKGTYSVGEDLVKQNTTFCQTECFAGTSRDGPSRETLMNLIAWRDSSASSHVLHTWPFRGLLLAS